MDTWRWHGRVSGGGMATRRLRDALRAPTCESRPHTGHRTARRLHRVPADVATAHALAQHRAAPCSTVSVSVTAILARRAALDGDDDDDDNSEWDDDEWDEQP